MSTTKPLPRDKKLGQLGERCVLVFHSVFSNKLVNLPWNLMFKSVSQTGPLLNIKVHPYLCLCVLIM